jgi:hypothetical protein
MPFKRGERVNYLGGRFNPVNGTYVWAKTQSLFTQYIIQHPDGFTKEAFMKDYLKGKSKNGIDGVNPAALNYDLKYIFVYEEDLIAFR